MARLIRAFRIQTKHGYAASQRIRGTHFTTAKKLALHAPVIRLYDGFERSSAGGTRSFFEGPA